MKAHILSMKSNLPRVKPRSIGKKHHNPTDRLCSLPPNQNITAINNHSSRDPIKAMASLATLAAIQPATIKGLSGSSLSGTKLHVKSTRQSLGPKSFRSGGIVAKYGDKSVYFDLEDLGNTTGQWDLYGSDAPSPYNPLQSKFFETFAAPFTKRGLLLKFLILGGAFTLTYLSATAPDDVLPIKKGPQLPPKLGPRGKI